MSIYLLVPNIRQTCWNNKKMTMTKSSKSLQVLFIHLQDLRLNPLSANPTKWSNTVKQFVGNLPTNCLNVFDHFMKLALKGLG